MSARDAFEGKLRVIALVSVGLVLRVINLTTRAVLIKPCQKYSIV
jgi:hypothetical protein